MKKLPEQVEYALEDFNDACPTSADESWEVSNQIYKAISYHAPGVGYARRRIISTGAIAAWVRGHDIIDAVIQDVDACTTSKAVESAIEINTVFREEVPRACAKLAAIYPDREQLFAQAAVGCPNKTSYVLVKYFGLPRGAAMSLANSDIFNGNKEADFGTAYSCILANFKPSLPDTWGYNLFLARLTGSAYHHNCISTSHVKLAVKRGISPDARTADVDQWITIVCAQLARICDAPADEFEYILAHFCKVPLYALIITERTYGTVPNTSDVHGILRRTQFAFSVMYDRIPLYLWAIHHSLPEGHPAALRILAHIIGPSGI